MENQQIGYDVGSYYYYFTFFSTSQQYLTKILNYILN